MPFLCVAKRKCDFSGVKKMSDVLGLEASLRDVYGKANSRRMRHQGMVPAVIYGVGKDPVSLTLEHNKVIKALENEAFYSQVLELNIAGKTEKVVLKDIQRHVYKPLVLHVDFLRVDAKSKLTMAVPLHFINEDIAHGVKMSNGVVTHQMTEVEVSCLPADLPEYLEIDIEKLELDQTLHLTDIKIPKGVELTALSQGEGHDNAVVGIVAQKQVEEIPTDAPDAPETEVPGEEAADEEASDKK